MNSSSPIVITSERLTLRYLMDSDIKNLLHYRSKPEIARYQFWEPYTEKDAFELIQKYKNGEPFLPGNWTQLGIVLTEDNKLIGDIALKIDGFQKHNGEIGFNLSPDYQGRGYATEAVKVLFDYAFEKLGLHRIIGICDARNEGSVKLMERIGMRREAHFKENVWFKGTWGDEYVYAVLKGEWEDK